MAFIIKLPQRHSHLQDMLLMPNFRTSLAIVMALMAGLPAPRASIAQENPAPAADYVCGAGRDAAPKVHAVVLAPDYLDYFKMASTQNDARLPQNFFTDCGIDPHFMTVAHGAEVARERTLTILRSVFAASLIDALQTMPDKTFTASEPFEQKVKPAVISAANAVTEDQSTGSSRITRAGDEPGSEFVFQVAEGICSRVHSLR